MARMLGDAAKAVDRRRRRSRQKKVGASEIGVCRRRAGYSHHNTPRSDPENATGIQAILGTWLHAGALHTMAREWGSLVETTVENETLRGHVDAIELPNALRVKAGFPEVEDAPDVVEVDDLKSKRDGKMVAYVRNRGPKRSDLFQPHLYGRMLRAGQVKPVKKHEKALASLGPLDVQTIRLRYFSRAGESDGQVQEYIYEQPYDEAVADEAWEWVEQVAASKAPEDLPRDEDGPGLSIVCDNCPFVTACWGEAAGHAVQTQLIVTDADLAATMRDYDEARTLESEAAERKSLARAKLDATRPAIYVDGGDLSYKVGWSGGRMGDPKPDLDAMIDLFREAGLEVPYLEAKPTARSIQVTRWDVPDEHCGKPVGEAEPYTPDGDFWLQDRQRGGWTCYRVMEHSGNPEEPVSYSHVQNELTAGEFTKRFPDYVEPRPPCILKKGHSGECRPDAFIEILDVPSAVT